MDSTVLDASAFAISPDIGRTLSVTADTALRNAFHLALADSLVNPKTYRLVVQGVQDVFANTAFDTAEFTYFRPFRGDLVLNEIMADPTPVVGLPPDALPGEEYLELYNQSGFAVNLANYRLLLNEDTVLLPDFRIKDRQHLTSTDRSLTTLFPDSITTLPALYKES